MTLKWYELCSSSWFVFLLCIVILLYCQIFFSRGSISPCEYFLITFFHGEALLAPRPTPKMEDHPSSAVRDCLFNIFAATLHIGGRSTIRNLRTRRAYQNARCNNKKPRIVSFFRVFHSTFIYVRPFLKLHDPEGGKSCRKVSNRCPKSPLSSRLRKT